MMSRCSAGRGATPVLSIAVILLMVGLGRADDGTDDGTNDAKAKALLASLSPEAAAADAVLSTIQKYRPESVQTIQKWDSGVGRFSKLESVFDKVWKDGVTLGMVKTTLRRLAARLPIEAQDKLLGEFVDEEARLSPGDNLATSDLAIPTRGASVQSALVSFAGMQGLTHGCYLQIFYNDESKDYTIASFMHTTSFALAPNQILITTSKKNLVSSKSKQHIQELVRGIEPADMVALQNIIAASVPRGLERRALGAAAPSQQPASQVPQSSDVTEL